ncbi:hypothetical protein ElyMa_002623400 [Elysia marginata]|uniref:Apple domain-containing protein n=1 Tax=Elysia marginata TaxID=1093978 RepID=A0AAV4H5R2_9GAST|nr:hypothetical protein ElyMa_002623400 [Elysia marginata]
MVMKATLSVCLSLGILLHHNSGCWASSIRFNKFQLVSGHRVSGGTEVSRHTHPDMNLVTCARRCLGDCTVFHFNKVNKLCVTFAEKPYEIQMTADTNLSIGYQPPSFLNAITYGEYTLVFRLQSGKPGLAYDTWIDTNRHDDEKPSSETFPLACLRMFDYASCDRHFRSKILDDWSGVTEVKAAKKFCL